MKKFLKILFTTVLTFLAASSIALAAISIVPNGGTGVGTITGLIKGNGTAPFSAATAGTDYQLPYWQRSGTTLSPVTAGDNINTTGSVSLGTATLGNNGLTSNHSYADPSAIVQEIIGVASISATTASNGNQVQGISANLSIQASNNQNWTSNIGLNSGQYISSIVSGATGTVTNMGNLRLSVSNSASGATITNAYNVKMLSPTMTGAITNYAYLLAGTNTQTAGNYFIDAANVTYQSVFGGSIGLGSIPTHSLTLASTTTGVAFYNTADQTVNYERVREAWSSNVFQWISEAGGTGTARNFSITGGLVGIGLNPSIARLEVLGNIAASNTGTTTTSGITAINSTGGAYAQIAGYGSAASGTFIQNNLAGGSAVILNPVGGTGLIGTMSNTALVFGTNNVERIRIGNGGAIAISSLPTSAGSYSIVTRNGSGVLEQVASTTYPAGSGTTNYLARWTGTNAVGIGTTYDTGTNVGIGTTTPGTPDASGRTGLDVSSNTLLLGSDNAARTRTNSTAKVGVLTYPHYTNAEEPVIGFYGSNTSTTNDLFIGGASSLYNTATSINFYTAANNTTLTGTQRMTISSSGNVGIGISPAVKFHVSVDGTTPVSALYDATDDAFLLSNTGASSGMRLLAASNTAANTGVINTLRARGTLTTPLVVQSGDLVLNLLAQGYDGSARKNAASIIMSVDGTPGSSDMPGRIAFLTSPDGSATLAERMRIDSAGAITINTVPITSAGTYDILARNSSTGVIEKITSTGHGSAINTFTATSNTVTVSQSTIRCDATTGAQTDTLPTVASAYNATNGIGQIFTFKKVDASANSCTLKGSGAETIDGTNTKVVSTQYNSLTVQSNGTSWDAI